jgi:prophage maintenance system killer protein
MAAATVFLRLNGYAFVAPDGEELGMFVERSILGSIPEPAFLKAMRKCVITTEEWEEFLRTRTKP